MKENQPSLHIVMKENQLSLHISTSFINVRQTYDTNSIIWRKNIFKKLQCVISFISENKTEDSLLVHTFYCLIQNSNSSSSSNWILMSFHPHRFTSGHRQISKLFSHIYISTLCQVSLQNQSLHKHKNTNKNFQRVSPFSITPVKRVHKAHAGIVDPSI